MSKNIQKRDKDTDDIELSDPELKEIEAMNSSNDFKDLNEEELDLDDLEAEINAMEGHSDTPLPTDENTKVAKKETIKNDCKISQTDLEKQYHGIECFFGNALEIELETIIPGLKSNLDKHKNDSDDFLICVNKKEMDLLKVKMNVQEKVGKHEITPEKYLEVLQKIHDKNKMVYQKASSDKIGKSDLTRINDRIEVLAAEIKEVKESLDGIPKADKQTDKCQKPVDPKEPDESISKQVKVAEDSFSLPLSDRKIEVPEQSQGIHPGIIHLAFKITTHLSFVNYLQKYFALEREEDVATLNVKIEAMKKCLEELKQNPEKADIQQLDTEYPNLESKFIIGMDRVERNKKIEAIFSEINADIKTIKLPKIIDLYKKHYQGLISRLVDVRDHPLAPLPVVVKKPFPVESNDVNKHIERGDLVFVLKNIKLPKPSRYFYLTMNFNYGENVFSETFPYNDVNGIYNVTKCFKLEEGKLLKKFAQEKITLTLFKKKYLISSRQVAVASVPLLRLKNYCDVPLTVDFDYKANKKISVEIEVSIHRALEQPMKDIFLFVIEKQVPAFSISHLKKSESSKQESEMASKAKLTPAEKESINPKVQPVLEEKKEVVLSSKNLKNEFASKYKFPLLCGPEKTRLAGTVNKLKLDNIYLNYQLACFCCTFLEVFEGEIEKQFAELAEAGDTEGRKEAEQLIMKTSQFKNYLQSNLENGKMSQSDYLGKIEPFVKLDKQLLEFYEKNGFLQSAYFVKNRLEILQGEIKQLKEMEAQQ